MGVDYTIEVYRKEDSKKIAEFFCNQIKNLFDNGIVDNCHDLDKFEISTMENFVADIRKRIDDANHKINDINNRIPMCKSREIKNAYEEDIRYIEEDITELWYAYNSVEQILGKMSVVVEDNINDKDEAAYQYNASDLGKDENGSKFLWLHDVYFKLIANY